MLKSDCESKGLDLSLCAKSDGASCYMSLHDSSGDMLLAINDMQAISALTPDYINGILPSINQSDGCVIDANLSEETLIFACERIKIPIIADAVSMHKCLKLKPCLKYISALKPNIYEARHMTGRTSPEDCARALMGEGVQRVVISLGSEGVYYADGESSGYISPLKRFSCQTNGAGDALSAGVAEGASKGLPARECAQIGINYAFRLLSARDACNFT